jgi:hypothetical protein
VWIQRSFLPPRRWFLLFWWDDASNFHGFYDILLGFIWVLFGFYDMLLGSCFFCWGLFVFFWMVWFMGFFMGLNSDFSPWHDGESRNIHKGSSPSNFDGFFLGGSHVFQSWRFHG